MMFQILIIILILTITIVFALKKQGVANIETKSEFKQRKVVVIFLLFSLLFAFIYWRTQSNLTEGLTQQGFVKTAENHYSIQLEDYEIELVYYPRTRRVNGEKERFELVITTRFSNLNIEPLFCNENEYLSYVNGKDRGWFPTAEKKLTNNYYVGQCYPAVIINAIEELPNKSHDFESRLMRYLFIPQLVNENQQRLEIHTDNTEINY